MDTQNLIPHILESMRLTLPLLLLIAGAIAVLMADVLLPAAQRWSLPVIALAVLAAAFRSLHAVGCPAPEADVFSYFGALQLNYLVFLAHNVILGGAVFLILISPRYLKGRAIPQGEYYALLLFATLAMMALAASAELLALFLNFELLSITMYILTGLEKKNPRSSEAAFKYFLIGSFAAAFLLLGIAFVFGATGQTRFVAITGVIMANKIIQPSFLAIGFGLIFIGFAFKLTLAPFHMYAPDVYEGAPTPIAAAIAAGSKVAGFVAFFHLIQIAAAWTTQPAGLWVALYAIVVASMVIGNIGAVVQPNIKRMLAYSSIAHSAYVIVPMVVVLKVPGLMNHARDAVAYYLMAYTVMTLVAFGVVAALAPAGEGKISSYAGLGRRSPWLALTMGVALIALVGIPPTVGFFGKLQLFAVAVEGGHIGLAITGVLASVASAYYYLRVIVAMYMEEPDAESAAIARPALGSVNAIALTLGALAIFIFAIFQGFYLFGS